MGKKKNRERGQSPKKDNWLNGTTTPAESTLVIKEENGEEANESRLAEVVKPTEVVDEKVDGGTPEEGWEAVQAEPELNKGDTVDVESKVTESTGTSVEEKGPNLAINMVPDEKRPDEKTEVAPPKIESSDTMKPSAPFNVIEDEKTPDGKSNVSPAELQQPERKKPSIPVDMVEDEKIPDEKPNVSPPEFQQPERKRTNTPVNMTADERIWLQAPKIYRRRVQPSNENPQSRIQNAIRAKIVINELDIVLQALKYIEWDNKNKKGHGSGLLDFNRVSQAKFEEAMKGYYETPQCSGGDFFPPIGAIQEFTDLYLASRLMIEEIHQAKAGPFFRGDVRGLTGVIMKDLTKLTHPRIIALQIPDRLRLKFLLQRTFRTHARLDPVLAPDEDEEDLTNVKDGFTEGLKRYMNSFPEMLPNGTNFLRLRLLLIVFALAGILYYSIWNVASTFTWDSSAVSRVFNSTKLSAYIPSTNSSTSFLPLYQQLEVYKFDINSTADAYEDCDPRISQAVELMLRRTEKLATDLKMIDMTIKLSKMLLLKSLFRLFNIASEATLYGRALGLYESYLADSQDEKYHPEKHTEDLKRILTDLETGLWRMEQTSQGNVPFDLNTFINEIVDRPAASFKGKRQRAVIRPDVLEQFRLYNDQVRAFAEENIFVLLAELKRLREVVRAQYRGYDPLQVQVNEIVDANAKLKKAKNLATMVKNKLENNGTIRARGAAILDLPS